MVLILVMARYPVKLKNQAPDNSILADFVKNESLSKFLSLILSYAIIRVIYFLGMDGRAENKLREEEARGANAGLCERAGDLQQQVGQKI